MGREGVRTGGGTEGKEEWEGRGRREEWEGVIGQRGDGSGGGWI